jgi:hypothetical protein
VPAAPDDVRRGVGNQRGDDPVVHQRGDGSSSPTITRVGA